MKFLFLLIVFIFFNNIAFAKNVKFSKFDEALFDCLIRYSEQRNKEGNGPAALMFKRRAYSILKTAAKPIRPVDVGIGISNGLDEAEVSRKRLMRFVENEEFIKQDYDMIAHIYCQFDIWMLESDSDWNTKVHKEEAKNSFLHNLAAIENKYYGALSFDEIGGGVIVDKTISGLKEDQCVQIAFGKNETSITHKMSLSVESLLKKKNDFYPYGVLIIGYIDWETEGHYAMLLGKKRMISMRNFILNAGVREEKISGDVVEILTKKENPETINTNVRVCLFNFLKHGKIGNKFVSLLEFNESEKSFNDEKFQLKNRKKE